MRIFGKGYIKTKNERKERRKEGIEKMIQSVKEKKNKERENYALKIRNKFQKSRDIEEKENNWWFGFFV